jgi:hypothetical protein
VGDGGIVGKEGEDAVVLLLATVGDGDGRGLLVWRSRLGEVDGPEVGGGGSGATENGVTVMSTEWGLKVAVQPWWLQRSPMERREDVGEACG